jgi:hypothetical protein
MRPFKFFFGLSLAVVVFFFLLRFVVFAFIVAAIMSIVYAVFRRMKDFITYDRYGQPYFDRYREHPRFNQYQEKELVEPLFYEKNYNSRPMAIGDVRFINIH